MSANNQTLIKKVQERVFQIKQFFKWYLNPFYWIKPFWVSFVEEAVLNSNYKGYIGGRVEIFTVWSRFDINEWRFFTKDTEGFYKIRDKYDLKQFSWWGLRRFKKIINQYNTKI